MNGEERNVSLDIFIMAMGFTIHFNSSNTSCLIVYAFLGLFYLFCLNLTKNVLENRILIIGFTKKVAVNQC